MKLKYLYPSGTKLNDPLLFSLFWPWLSEPINWSNFLLILVKIYERYCCSSCDIDLIYFVNSCVSSSTRVSTDKCQWVVAKIDLTNVHNESHCQGETIVTNICCVESYVRTNGWPWSSGWTFKHRKSMPICVVERGYGCKIPFRFKFAHTIWM